MPSLGKRKSVWESQNSLLLSGLEMTDIKSGKERE